MGSAAPPEAAHRDARAFALVWIPYVLLARAFWFVTDDAFISFRYSRNWAAGHGLRYNLGDHVPVEGYSNFLWVLWCGVVEKLGGDVTFWAPATSLACGVVLLFLVFRALRRTLRLDLSLALLAAWSLALFAPFFVWSTGGLATMPFALAVFLTFERLVLRPAGPAPLAAGVAGIAACLLRVEGLAWVILACGGAAVSSRLSGRRELRPFLTSFGMAAAGFAAFLLWRHAYHGSWVSNTAAAKVGLSGGLIARGLEYVGVLVTTFVTPLLLVPAALIALGRERRALGVPLVGLTAAAFGYAVAVGGDFMAMGRLFLPGLAFGALLFGGLLGWLANRGRRGAAIGLGAGAVLLALLPVADIHVVPESVRSRFNVREHWGKYWTETEYWNVMRWNGARWKRLGLTLKEVADPGDSVVAPGIGNIGYYSGLFIHDQAGLVDREVAHRPTERLTAPGHDKIVPVDFFLPRRPDLLSPVLVRDGAERRRTAEAMLRESERLARDYGARYDLVEREASAALPRPPSGAEDAILSNLLGPLRGGAGAAGPKEFLLVLRRSAE